MINFKCSLLAGVSDGHDKPFCTKAITIIDKSKNLWAIPIIRVPTLVLKVWKNNIAFSRLKKFEKIIFFTYIGMENENIFPDLIPHFDNDCLYVFSLQCLIWACH